MQSSHLQAANAVVMIRPHHFYPNQQTRQDNSFQSTPTSTSKHELALRAYHQVTSMADQLSQLGIKVNLFEDTGKSTPDSVFPNNWFSTHSDNRIVTYPMYPKNRRIERRADILAQLSEQFNVSQIIDYSPFEEQGVFLEGTGAMVLDHHDKIAYTVRSNRANEVALAQFCKEFDYQAVLFDAQDQQGVAIYHTNVLMCIGSQFAMYSPQMIHNSQQRETVEQRLLASGKEIISLSSQQISQFCGNALELQATQGKILALSETAFTALTAQQKQKLERSVKLVTFDVSAIETAGGSVRCMLAGIHLN